MDTTRLSVEAKVSCRQGFGYFYSYFMPCVFLRYAARAIWMHRALQLGAGGSRTTLIGEIRCQCILKVLTDGELEENGGLPAPQKRNGTPGALIREAVGFFQCALHFKLLASAAWSFYLHHFDTNGCIKLKWPSYSILVNAVGHDIFVGLI